MFSIIVEFYKDTYNAARHLLRASIPGAPTVTSWGSPLIRFFAIWILVNIALVNVADFWYSLNFKEPWKPSDYLPLRSDQVVTRLLPWMTSEYAPLHAAGSNIRLLHIHPSRDVWGIEATLEYKSFLERPRYRALSYAWGDTTKVKPITVNGKRMNVTENLWNALFHIRDQHYTQTLWVDAICINQENNEEKSIQVPLMSFIYSRAQEVIVWLGDHRAPRWVEHASLAQWNGDWATTKANEHWPVTKYWLYTLTQEEYWKRCWVVQEIAMGSRIRVFSRRSKLPWAEFVKLIKLYKSKMPLEIGAVDNVLKLELLREAKYTDGNAYSLARLLEEFSDCFCSINLDKIYAFLGLASDCVQGCMEVDYTKSPATVYQELLSFWNSRCLETGDEAVGTIQFAALVRSVLSRSAVLVPKTLKLPAIGESAQSFLYFVCGDDRAEYCKLIPTLQLTLTWVDIMNTLSHRLLFYSFKSRTQTKSLWLPSAPESSLTWAAKTGTQLRSDHRPIRVRGIMAGAICDLGPTYREFIEHPNVLRQWTSKLRTVWGLACNQTSMRSARVLNEKLAMLLGAAADYRMRNFVSLDHNSPYSFYSSRLFIGFGPGREVVMGLAPWEAVSGDVLIQYWNTNAVLVIRMLANRAPKLLGRAGIVKDGHAVDWDVPKNRGLFGPLGPHSDQVFDTFIASTTLTQLSFDTVCLPGTYPHGYQESPLQPKDIWTSHDFEMKELNLFGDGNMYDNTWSAEMEARLGTIDLNDLEESCFSRPCQKHVVPDDRFLPIKIGLDGF